MRRLHFFPGSVKLRESTGRAGGLPKGNYVPLTVTDNTDHFNLLEESAYGAIERVPFRMPFNSKYQPLYHVASDRSLLQGWNTDPFPEV